MHVALLGLAGVGAYMVAAPCLFFLSMRGNCPSCWGWANVIVLSTRATADGSQASETSTWILEAALAVMDPVLGVVNASAPCKLGTFESFVPANAALATAIDIPTGLDLCDAHRLWSRQVSAGRSDGSSTTAHLGALLFALMLGFYTWVTAENWRRHRSLGAAFADTCLFRWSPPAGAPPAAVPVPAPSVVVVDQALAPAAELLVRAEAEAAPLLNGAVARAPASAQTLAAREASPPPIAPMPTSRASTQLFGNVRTARSRSAVADSPHGRRDSPASEHEQ
jgi:hypothetical protein